MASGGGEAANVMPLPGEASKAAALSPLPRGTPATSLALSRPTPQQPAPCTATTATTFAPTPRSSLSVSGGGCGGSKVAANNGSGLAPAAASAAECASRELFTDFNRRDAELHNPSPSSTCVARIKTGARKNSVCGVKQAFVNAATPDKVRQYELGMFKFMPAAEALMVLECTGDPPSEEQLQEWVRTTTAAKVDAEIRSRIASQSQSSGEPPESVVASLGLGDAAV